MAKISRIRVRAAHLPSGAPAWLRQAARGPFARQKTMAMQLLRRLRGQMEQRAFIRDLAAPATAPEGVDLDHPVWWALMTSYPVMLNHEQRARCEMLIGFAPKGAPPPNPEPLAKRASALFARAATKAGFPQASVHIRSEPLWAEGRVIRSLPGYGASPRGSGLGSIFGDRSLFDARRALRRESEPTPSRWVEEYGREAEQLWKAGMSLARERARRFENWTQCARAAAQAMREAGLATYRCHDFFQQRPEALDTRELMEAVDLGWLDPIRQRWALEAASDPSTASKPRHSL